MDLSYSSHFDSNEAVDYARMYDEPSYSKLLWQVEQAQLERLLARFRATHPHIDHLDFASGTGRIIQFIEGRVDTSVGIEISPDMIEIARSRVKKSRLICKDITAPGAEVEGQYDLITAFRFVLNAEPNLRLAALRALRARLRDASSWLIFNNHGNLWSHKALLWPYHRVRRAGSGRLPAGNYLSHSEIMEATRAAGLEAERVQGCGVLSAKMLKILPFDRLVQLEQWLAEREELSRWGVNQLYVARMR